MLRQEDIESILTTCDLSVCLNDWMQKEDRDLKIDIDYESIELFINCPGFSDGLSVTIDPFWVWVINQVISHDIDGINTQSGNHHKTEKTMTVLQAIACWIVVFERLPEKSDKEIIIFLSREMTNQCGSYLSFNQLPPVS